jgi:ADYC domain
MTKLKAEWMGIALVGALLGASGFVSPTSAWALGDCEVTGCGSNTPVLFGTPIIGLSLEGRPNDVGVKLDPVFRRARPLPPAPLEDCDGARIDIENGALIGIKPRGERCTGRALVGLAVSLEVPVRICHEHGRCPTTRRTQVLIDGMSEVSTWSTSDARLVPTYRMVWGELSVSGEVVGATTSDKVKEGDSICPRREAWMEDWQDDKGQESKKWKVKTDEVLIVHGETYKSDASVTRKGLGWFNIACVGTALAKMRLLGYDPAATASDASTPGDRQATLKMLTARYRGETSYTSPGVPLRWIRKDKAGFYGTPDASFQPEAIESYWGPNGALCLSHRRTWRKLGPQNLQTPTPELSQPPILTIRAMGYDKAEARFVSPILAAGGSDSRRVPTTCRKLERGYVWITYAVDHVVHSP